MAVGAAFREVNRRATLLGGSGWIGEGELLGTRRDNRDRLAAAFPELANVGNELPDAIVGVLTREPGHVHEAQAVLDDPERLAVGQILAERVLEVRRRRIEVLAEHSLSVPGGSVAD